MQEITHLLGNPTETASKIFPPSSSHLSLSTGSKHVFPPVLITKSFTFTSTSQNSLPPKARLLLRSPTASTLSQSTANFQCYSTSLMVTQIIPPSFLNTLMSSRTPQSPGSPQVSVATPFSL